MSRSPSRLRLITRRALKRLAILFVLLAVVLVWGYFTMIRMPGRSFAGPLPPLTESQSALADELRRDVTMLAGTIGRRNTLYSTGLAEAVAFLEHSLHEAGFATHRQTFRSTGLEVCNLEVEIRGSMKPDEIVVIGAHYDSVDDSPAANDNASGVAATLALARRFAGGIGPLSAQTPVGDGVTAPARTLRFVLFVNEEPPNFKTEEMGSLVYAKACRDRGERIVAMLSLETIGYYSDAP